MTLPVKDIVSVEISVAPQPPVARGFGIGLILGLSARLRPDNRVQAYPGIAAVGADFQTTDEEYKAANVYFSQNPAPKTLLIGRQFSAGAAGYVIGGTADTTLADWTAITTGGFDISIDGVLKQIAALNFSSCATMAQVAAVIGTALNAAAAGTTCVWTGAAFVITSPTAVTGTVSFAAAPTHAGSPVDVHTMLGLTSAAGATIYGGLAVEAQTDALNASLTFNNTWYGLALVTTMTAQDNKDSMAFCEANTIAFSCTTGDANCVNPGNTTDLGSFAKAAGYTHTIVTYSTLSPYAGVSALARALIVDFTQPNATITLMFKSLPGVLIEGSLTESQSLALKGKNINFYASYGGFSMYATGVTSSGRFFDEVMGLDWLQATLQNAIFTVLTGVTTKVPQTDPGSQMLIQAINTVLAQAKNNGLLAPGNWNGSAVGEVASGAFLANGYYAYAAPVATMSPSDRAARKAPPLTAIGIGAGAIQSVDLNFTFQR